MNEAMPANRINGCRGHVIALAAAVVACWATARWTGAVEPDVAALAEQLRRLDVCVFATNDLPQEMVQRDINARRRAAVERENRLWRAVGDRTQWEAFRAPRLDRLRRSLGTLAKPGEPLKSRVTGTIPGDGYRIENVVFESRPGLWVTANLYLPSSTRKALPGIVLCHSHHHPKTEGELQDMGILWARVGCAVLVMDQLGHGERRQHSFRTAADYPARFAVGRQDYYFRYDAALQLYLVGESLTGWMVQDLLRGVDLLVARPDVDRQRIVLLGSVAGGGDPAAVAAALDERIAAVVPFNFGGPQPETQYPLPADADSTFNYAGSGSWESTRNLRGSVRDGFLPWVIVGSMAPRRLIYAHEFSWDRERDPVWVRLQTVYGWRQAQDHLSFTHGRGTLTGHASEATHCNNIGPVHREAIHTALARWFEIPVPDEKKSRRRLPPDELTCMTAATTAELRPQHVHQLAAELAASRLATARAARASLSPDRRIARLRDELSAVLGKVEAPPGAVVMASSRSEFELAGARGEKMSLTVEPRIHVPLILVRPTTDEGDSPPVVVAVCQAGKERWLRERSHEVARLLRNGMAVCAIDVRGTGETRVGDGRGRTSAATALAADEWMLGRTLLAGQLFDLRAALGYLRTRPDVDGRRLALWGDSLVAPNPAVAPMKPHGIDHPTASPEPAGALLALLAALHEDQVAAIVVRGAVYAFQSALETPDCSLPADVVLPDLLTIADLSDLVAAVAKQPVRIQGLVDGRNRPVTKRQILDAWRPSTSTSALPPIEQMLDNAQEDLAPTVEWLVTKLRKTAK